MAGASSDVRSVAAPPLECADVRNGTMLRLVAAPKGRDAGDRSRPPSAPRVAAAAPARSDRDPVLVARVRSGDAAAFEEIVLAYTGPLSAFAWRYVGAADPAADIVQDVFAHLWEHRQRLTIRHSLRAYLYAATRNGALNALDRARVESRLHAADAAALLAPPPVAADTAVEHAELAAAVEAALSALPPRGREIARLRWIERMSRREIAEVLGLAVPTVSVHLTRAAERLRVLLAGMRG